MPISFRCETCRRSIRVPDGSEGKRTRCPDCYSIIQIPFEPLAKAAKKPQAFTAPNEVEDPLGIAGKNESRWEATYPLNKSPEEAAPTGKATVNHDTPPNTNGAANSNSHSSQNPFADHKEATNASETVPLNTFEADDEDTEQQELAARSCQTVATIATG